MHQIVEKRNSIYEIIIIMYHYIVLIITVSVLDSIFVVGRVLLGFLVGLFLLVLFLLIFKINTDLFCVGKKKFKIV